MNRRKPMCVALACVVGVLAEHVIGQHTSGLEDTSADFVLLDEALTWSAAQETCDFS